MNDAIDFLTRPLLAVARGVMWVVSEFFFHIVLWCIGWPLWRLLSLGRYPETGFGDGEEAGTIETILVSGLGLAVLAGLGWLLLG